MNAPLNVQRFSLGNKHHRQLFTGEATFQQFTHYYLRIGAAWLGGTVICVLLVVTRTDIWFAYGFIGIFVTLAFAGAAALTAARYSDLTDGQFWDAEVLDCTVVEYLTRRQFLRIEYGFTSPDGRLLGGIDSVLRSDSEWDMFEPGMRLKVRYVDDHTFRLM